MVEIIKATLSPNVLEEIIRNRIANYETLFSEDHLFSVKNEFKTKVEQGIQEWQEKRNYSHGSTVYLHGPVPDLSDMLFWDPTNTDYTFARPTIQSRPYIVDKKENSVTVKDMITGKRYESKIVNPLINIIDNNANMPNNYASRTSEVIPIIIQLGKKSTLNKIDEDLLIPFEQDVKKNICVLENYVTPFKANVNYVIPHIQELRYGITKLGWKCWHNFHRINVEIKGGITTDGCFGKLLESEVTNVQISSYNFEMNETNTGGELFMIGNRAISFASPFLGAYLGIKIGQTNPGLFGFGSFLTGLTAGIFSAYQIFSHPKKIIEEAQDRLNFSNNFSKKNIKRKINTNSVLNSKYFFKKLIS